MEREVVVTDIDMPFLSMVGFMIKWAIAAIPALIILAVMGAVFFYSLGTIAIKTHQLTMFVSNHPTHTLVAVLLLLCLLLGLRFRKK